MNLIHRYKAKAHELSVIFKDQPETPLKRAVFWTEYVIRYKGANHLRSAARNLSYLQYHDIDLVVFIFTIFMFLAWILVKCKEKWLVGYCWIGVLIMLLVSRLMGYNFINLSIN